MKSRTVSMACIIAITISLVVFSAGCTTSTNTTTSPTTTASTTGTSTASATADSMTILGNMAMYQNATVGVQFTYPQSWNVSPDPTNNGQYPNTYYTIWPNNGDNQSGMIFWKFSNTDNETLSNFVNSDLQSYRNDNGTTVVQNVTSATLGGMPALKFVVLRNVDNTPSERLITAAANGDSIYAVGYYASPSYYAGTLNDAQQVINSFAFTAPTTTSGNMATYQNATVGVQFTYPQSWTVNPNPTSNGASPARYYNIWPDNGDNESGVGFLKYSNTGNETLLNAVNSVLQSYRSENGTTVVQNVTSATLGGMPALKFVVTWNSNNNPQTPIETLYICTVKGDSFYSIRYGASPSYYAGTLNDVEQIINSFTFI